MTLNVTTTNLSAKAANEWAMQVRAIGQLDRAIEMLQQFAEQLPNEGAVWCNLGVCMMEVGRLDEAIACYRKAIGLAPWLPEPRGALIMALMYSEKHTQADVEAEQAGYQAWLDGFITPRTSWPKRAEGKKVRVAYVSGDLNDHAMSRFMLPVLSNHTDAVEVVVYATGKWDWMTQRIGEGPGKGIWRDCRDMSDEDLDALIFGDEIDVLIDLGGITAGGRPLVVARKPSPVQISYLSHPGDTGMKAHDYFLSDRVLGLGPRALELSSYWTFAKSPEFPPVEPVPHEGVVFGSLANFAKITDEMLVAWRKILDGVEGSRLIMHAPDGSAREKVLRILPANRVEFVGRQSYVEYLKTWNRVDIGVDTYPWAGGTTAAEALAMGIPLVTMRGPKVASRSAASISAACGRGDCVVDSIAGYIALAKQLAEGIDHLAGMRGRFIESLPSSRLFDIKTHVAELEACYRSAWMRYCGRGRGSG